VLVATLRLLAAPAGGRPRGNPAPPAAQAAAGAPRIRQARTTSSTCGAIALYPDPLLAQCSWRHPIDIVAAQRG
jgi:hypothetical protein